ncbi:MULTISPECIES: preprotein translocase subunit YajC [Neisseria]|uniref:Sec translocon accessory complex subunit YajC n=2 Tax=Neisseria TaxID=482 RepID=A0AB38DS18_9NEIS|nr:MULTISPECIES: preprotein translocase subunit YajC [Neisseria]OSI11572.1 preprotein translocase subunit YajC [Neisseria zoodegmatis]OSI22051.1 preprotein translocase subunit YajC [Neisseria dumasiana]SNU79876.1 preprotein translocase subunit YajC [Neisseria zoodegmatis]
MIDFAYAADAAQPNFLMSMAPMILIIVVFYFLIMRPQQKKFKAHQAMIAELKVGDKVLLASGFKGTVKKVSEQFFTVEIARGVEVEVERNAVASKVA